MDLEKYLKRLNKDLSRDMKDLADLKKGAANLAAKVERDKEKIKKVREMMG